MHTVYVNPNTNTVYAQLMFELTLFYAHSLCIQFMHTVCSYEKQCIVYAHSV